MEAPVAPASTPPEVVPSGANAAARRDGERAVSERAVSERAVSERAVSERAVSERAVSWLVAGVVALAAAGPISDNSLLTHIATGRLQVRGGLPHTNPFLYSSSDFPVPSWWWSAVLGWADRWLGLTGVRLLTAVVAGVLGWVVVRASRPVTDPTRPTRNAMAQLLPAAVVLALLGPFLNGRPQLPGFVLLAVSLVVWRERRSPWWLVAVFAVWVNVHGSWLYGIAVLGLLWLAEMLDDRAWHSERLRWLGGVAGGVVLGGVFYPERFRLVVLPTEQFGSSEARQAVKLYQEWQPVSPTSALAWVFAVVVVLALVGVWRRGSLASRAVDGSTPRGRVGSAVVVVALAAMGLSAYRLLPFAAIALAAFAAVGVESVSGIGLPSRPVRTAMAVLGALALAAALVRATRPPDTDLTRFPVDEVTWLQHRDLVANPQVRLITPDFVGNYLEFRYGDRARAWVDDRPSPRTLIDYVSLRRMQGEWRDALRRADPDVILWRRSDPFADMMARRDGWVVGLTTDDFRVLCREEIADRCR